MANSLEGKEIALVFYGSSEVVSWLDSENDSGDIWALEVSEDLRVGLFNGTEI